MVKTVFFILFVHFEVILKTKGENCNEHKSVYSYYEKRADQGHFSSNVTLSFFLNFQEFNDLILDCHQTYNITNHVVMNPKQPLIVDENFNLKKIINQTQINSIEYLKIGNLKGFDLNSNHLF